MSISRDDNSYLSEEKSKWREFVYSLLSSENCSCLVDGDNNLKYKWLELVGDNALTFDQLLNTGRISESMLIGIDNREDNIKRCSERLSSAMFCACDWDSFCRRYTKNDIGVIVFDSWNAAFGKEFDYSLLSTVKLALNCKKNIGECLVVVNVDSSKTYRSCAIKHNKTSRHILKEGIESVLRKVGDKRLLNYEIDVDNMYEYKQHKASTTMLTCGFLI